jgi:agarase
LILGVKMITQLAPREVLEAATPYVDVFSVDDYSLLPGLEDQIQQTWGPFVTRDATLSEFYAVVRRPLMVMEYSFRAADAGVPNSWPPIFPTFATQQERADAYEQYVRTLYTAPWIIGDHWFEYVDEPAGGRFDGEDSNFGLVSTTDDAWQTLVDRAARLHAVQPDNFVRDRDRCWAWQRTGHRDDVRCVDSPSHRVADAG